MSRWIEYDDAIERLGAYLMADAQIEWGGTASEDIEDWKELATDILRGSPSIDIVRCAECKYKQQCHKAVEHTTHKPTSVTIAYRPIDFCSYGEREGE